MEITKEELERKYNSMTNDELAQELGVSKVTLIKYINELGIKPKGKGYNKKLIINKTGIKKR